MINLNTKAEGMSYTLNGNTYIIKHGYFKVIDFAEVPGENKYKIHVQNKDYDTVIIPFKDPKETLTIPCVIKMAYIETNYGINCHGYEVVDNYPEELNTIDNARKIVLTVTYINVIKTASIKSFVINILEKKWNMFSIWPAANSVHHNYKSGLLQHTVNVVKNAYNLALNYNDIDLDVLISGAILHDIGKIYEYDQDGNISGEGKLFDHINIGTRIIFEEYYHGDNNIYSFPERTLQHIAHVILSHHGKMEWGSSRTPATQEAMLVHYADYIDANMFIAHKELQNLEFDTNIKSKYLGQLIQTKFDMEEFYDK